MAKTDWSWMIMVTILALGVATVISGIFLWVGIEVFNQDWNWSYTNAFYTAIAIWLFLAFVAWVWGSKRCR